MSEGHLQTSESLSPSLTLTASVTTFPNIKESPAATKTADLRASVSSSAATRANIKAKPTPARIFLGKFFKSLAGFIRSFAIIFIIIALWEAFPRFNWIDPFLLPRFSDVVSGFITLLKTGEFFKHFNVSIVRISSGFFGGLCLAIPIGVFMGWFKTFEEYVNPVVEACRNSSVLTLYPIFILLFGIGEQAKIAIIMWGTTWVVLLNTISGVKNVDPVLIKSARSMGVKDLPLLWKVVLPAATPSIITGVRLGASNSILILIAAEMIGSNSGLGFMIFYFEARYAIPEMYSGVIFLALMGVTVHEILCRVERYLTSWHEKSIYFGT
ncbi:MAG: ABC transporter permease [Deltaproteobacteria bacterium]|jgi:NitT/TauT family transport system permease protein|nr:ABC transporter permease [Deltaproteobacteria bacterium]